LASVSFGIWQLLDRQPDAAPSGGSDSGYIVADDDHVIATVSTSFHIHVA
jgi:hypothetical protein